MSPSMHDCCPLCQTQYSDEHVFILQETDVAVLQHCTCDSCAAKLISMQIDSDVGTGSIGMITDLTAEEHCTFGDKEQISEDDVLNLYTLLQHNAKQFVKECSQV